MLAFFFFRNLILKGPVCRGHGFVRIRPGCCRAVTKFIQEISDSVSTFRMSHASGENER